MNLVFDTYSDNPVVAALVSWPPRPGGIAQIRACCPLLRKPFIEIDYQDGQSSHHAFGKQGFMRFWQETETLLGCLTNIPVVKEFTVPPMEDRDAFLLDINTCLDQSIAESNAIFDGGMYQLFLDQYGANCKELPDEVCARIKQARSIVENHMAP